jgi:hypothetical protein
MVVCADCELSVLPLDGASLSFILVGRYSLASDLTTLDPAFPKTLIGLCSIKIIKF